MAQCLLLAGLVYASSDSGRIALVQDLAPACQVCAIRTGNAQKTTQCGSLTLTLLNFNTTNKEGQKLWVYQIKASASSCSPTTNTAGLWSFEV